MSTRQFIILKSSRYGDSEGYDGPTCTDAGVEPGLIYGDRMLAQRDADKLTAHNPVGFEVVEIAAAGSDVKDEVARLIRENAHLRQALLWLWVWARCNINPPPPNSQVELAIKRVDPALWDELFALPKRPPVRRPRGYGEHLDQVLQDRHQALAYLAAAAEEEEPEIFMQALQDCIRAEGLR